jgi:hypothetical protein
MMSDDSWQSFADSQDHPDGLATQADGGLSALQTA